MELKDLIKTLPSYEAEKTDPGYRSYIGWCPDDDYMRGDGQWNTNFVYETWEDFYKEMKDCDIDFNLVADFYFRINSDSKECPACDGCGYNKETKKIEEDFYDSKKTGRKWHNNITQDEVEALMRKGRIPVKTWKYNIFETSSIETIMSATKRGQFPFKEETESYSYYPFYDENDHLWKKIISENGESKIVIIPEPQYPTASQINKSYENGLGHDAINRGILVKQRATRMGVYGHCEDCDGEGYIKLSEDYLTLYIWLLHPRKGSSKGMTVKRVSIEDFKEVKEYLSLSIEAHKKHFKWVNEPQPETIIFPDINSCTKELKQVTPNKETIMSLVETTVKQVIIEKTGNNEKFTAYDITKEVRVRLGKSVKVSHTEVKKIVHNEFEDVSGLIPMTYSRALSDLGDPKPWIYFPISSLPDTDEEEDRDEDEDEDNKDDNSSSDSTECVVTNENRINIPSRFLDKIICYPISGYVFKISGIDSPVKGYHNADGRVRIAVPYPSGSRVRLSVEKTNIPGSTEYIKVEKI